MMSLTILILPFGLKRCQDLESQCLLIDYIRLAVPSQAVSDKFLLKRYFMLSILLVYLQI